MKNNPEVKLESKRILLKHTNSDEKHLIILEKMKNSLIIMFSCIWSCSEEVDIKKLKNQL